MSGKVCHPGWLALFLVLVAAQAFGQFEVSPDHFNDSATPAAQKVQHKKTIRQQATAGKALLVWSQNKNGSRPTLLKNKLKQWPRRSDQAGVMCSEDTEEYLICSAL